MKRVYNAVLVLLVFSLLFLPALAEARGGHGGGHGGGHRGGRGAGHSHGHCGHKGHGGSHGGASGVFIGGAYLAPPAYETYPACYEMVPEHLESEWNPETQRYEDVLVPEQFVPVPCQ